MKTYFPKMAVIAAIVATGCTPKANTYYNRQMQPIVTKYNVLFNGEEALDKGLTELYQKYQDDFSEVLPVEPIRMSGKVQLDGIENPHFQRAEEKAIKTIQHHSMVFKGEQRNYKIDDAYILLGKARYYNERFLPALEAFNHLLTNYGKSNRIPEAAVWAQKTNLRLGKDKIAIEKLQHLLETEKLHRNQKAEAYSTLGQAYINEQMYQQAADALYAAGKFTKNSALRGRYYFIAAQLYEKQQLTDSALVAYQKVIKQNWKIPRKLWVEAQAGKARNKNFSPQEKNEFLTYLTKLENRYEHKDFLDVLYFTHGNIIGEDNVKKATEFYRKSLKNNKENNPLKAQTHQQLADIFFREKNYTLAYHHLDSTLAYIPEKTFKHLYVERKKENLSKITELEYVLKNNDSILKIVRLSEEEKRIFFQKHIDSVQKIAQQKSLQQENNDVQNFGNISQNRQQPNDGKFYFYNPMAVAYGKQLFHQQWGNRKLEDNWRWSSKENTEFSEEAKTSDNQKVTENTDLTPNDFIGKLPQSEDEISSLENERNRALYQLGVLYKSKFNDNELSINRLKRLLTHSPDSDLEVATLYQLYKIYTDLNHHQSEEIKNQINSKYPTSDYASLLKGESTWQQQKDQLAQQFLDSLYHHFHNGKIEETARLIERESMQYRETSRAVSIEMMKAKTLGRLHGISAYTKALENLILNFPDTAESEEAKTILGQLQVIEKETFIPDNKAQSWKILITEIPSEIREKVRLSVSEKMAHLSEKIQISEDVYAPDQIWLVIHKLDNRPTAESVLEDLEAIISENGLSAHVISTENYRLVQIKKNFNELKK